jgi:hypothetical protein
MRPFISLALMLALSGCPVAVPAAAAPIVIGDSNGGSVWSFAFFYEAIEASGVPVEVDGICISSCTLALLMPKSQVCLTERTTLGFHAVTTNGRPDVGMTEAVQRRYFPAVLQKFLDDYWEAQPGGIPTVRDIYLVPAKTLAEIGAVRICDAPVVEAIE